MAQIGTPPVIQKRGAASSNVYTILVVVAFLALAVGVGFVWFKSGKLFNTGNPFELTHASGPARPGGR